MESNPWISRLFGPGAEEQSSCAARESVSQLRVPTLDERIGLYCRAVYEKHDFGNEAYSDARDRILDAMAADIATKSEINLPEEAQPFSFPEDTGPTETAVLHDLLAYQHSYASEHATSPPTPASFDELSEPLIDRARLHTKQRVAYTSPRFARADVSEDASSSHRKISPRRQRTLKSAMLAVSMCVVAVIGASVTLGVLREFGVAPKLDLDIAVQSLQKGSETRFRAVTRNGPTNAPDMAPTSAPIAEPPSRNTIANLDGPTLTNPSTREEIANLVKRGRELIAAGKISDARQLLRSAADADAGSAQNKMRRQQVGARQRDKFPPLKKAAAAIRRASSLGRQLGRGSPGSSSKCTVSRHMVCVGCCLLIPLRGRYGAMTTAYFDNCIVSGMVRGDLESAEMTAVRSLKKVIEDGRLQIVTSRESWREQERATDPTVRAVLERARPDVPLVKENEKLLGMHSYGDQRTWKIGRAHV